MESSISTKSPRDWNNFSVKWEESKKLKRFLNSCIRTTIVDAAQMMKTTMMMEVYSD